MLRNRYVRLATGLIGSLSIVTVAAASEGTQRVCYQRVYDAAHLVQHPQQLVTQIGILVGYNPQDRDNAFPYTVFAKVRNRAYVMHNSGSCGFRDDDGLEVNMPGGEELTGKATIACSADGDQGGVLVKRIGNGQKALMQLEPMLHITLTGDCGDASCTYDLKPGADDKSFLADRMPDAICGEMEKAKK